MRIERVLAPNPGPFTGAGTNTWVVDGDGRVAIIDPGPVISSHADAIVERVGHRRVAAVVVTHTHEDHAPLANSLAGAFGVPALGYAAGPGFDPDDLLSDGSLVEVGGVTLEVIYTPGHSDDHLCFLTGRVLFTGDHIIGGSSVMVDEMGSYLHSLERLRKLDLDRLHPGHGEVMDEPHRVIDWYVAHRLQRESEILAEVVGGARSVAEITESVYRDVHTDLHPLAARSVVAHLRKLTADGVVRFDGRFAEPSANHRTSP
ncbi:MBL fold metallo-hydrolase [soil metagenome]